MPIITLKRVYFSAPCYVNASDNLISKEIRLHGQKANLECKKGFTLSGIIRGEMPVCFNGTWKFEYARFPYCKSDDKIAKTRESWWSFFKRQASKFG